MASAWVLAFDLVARLSDFLDHEVRLAVSDDAFDLTDLMLRLDDEVERIRSNLVVDVRLELDRVGASELAALAVKRKHRRDLVLFGSLIDLLVDLPEDLFVVCRPLCEVHGRLFPSAKSLLGGVLGAVLLKQPASGEIAQATCTAAALYA
jgi:hypothetical protein